MLSRIAASALDRGGTACSVPNVQDAINEQINNELSSSYSYLAMSTYCERQNFLGCARWLRIQSQEEYGHGMRLLDFLLARDGTVQAQGRARAAVRIQLDRRGLRAGAAAGTGSQPADRPALRAGA